MALQLKVAQRKKAKLKLGISAPPGGGKTLGALLIAYGLMKESYPNLPDAEIWAKIAIIDTENGSGELYVGKEVDGLVIGDYNAITLTAPFEADKYTKGIILCDESGIEVVIIDSTTHLWSGQGGLLEQQGTIAKRTGNSYTAWREVTPQHNRFIETMLQTNVHIIATMRSKVDYVQEKNSEGKTVVRKIGLNPVQKEGMEYEFTTFLDVDSDHTAFGSKDRTGLVDQKYFVITPKVGRDLMAWLNSGVDTKSVVRATETTPLPPVKEEAQKSDKEKMTDLQNALIAKLTELDARNNPELMEVLKAWDASMNPKKVKDMAKLAELSTKLETFNK